MGELLLCKEPIAAMPYYIEGISINVYSLEELCYYISHNTYLLEQNFMDPELCAWVENELKLTELAEELRRQIYEKGRLSEFIALILKECGYCTREEVRNIYDVLQELEGKSDYECSKIRADRLMEKEKYLSSIYEYKRLLDSEETLGEAPETVGNIWHNLGTAYARMFLFEEAGNCFEKAYHYNKNEESLKECLLAHQCRKDEAGFYQTAEKYGVSQETLQELQEQMQEKEPDGTFTEFSENLKVLQALLDSGDRRQYRKEVENMILKWKEDYRRICRI